MQAERLNRTEQNSTVQYSREQHNVPTVSSVILVGCPATVRIVQSQNHVDRVLEALGGYVAEGKWSSTHR